MRKVYIALFSCCVTRALYLDDLSENLFEKIYRQNGNSHFDRVRQRQNVQKDRERTGNALPSPRDKSGTGEQTN